MFDRKSYVKSLPAGSEFPCYRRAFTDGFNESELPNFNCAAFFYDNGDCDNAPEQPSLPLPPPTSEFFTDFRIDEKQLMDSEIQVDIKILTTEPVAGYEFTIMATPSSGAILTMVESGELLQEENWLLVSNSTTGTIVAFSVEGSTLAEVDDTAFVPF